MVPVLDDPPTEKVAVFVVVLTSFTELRVMVGTVKRVAALLTIGGTSKSVLPIITLYFLAFSSGVRLFNTRVLVLSPSYSMLLAGISTKTLPLASVDTCHL